MSELKLSSPSFKNGDTIPEKHTCDGLAINPELHISGVDQAATSLVLFVDDPDVPKQIRADQMFDHWVVFNIPRSTEVIEEGQDPDGTIGANSNNNPGYFGMCPPPQYEPKEHRYQFKLFALDKTLDLPKGSTKNEVADAMDGHIIQEDKITGVYERSQ